MLRKEDQLSDIRLAFAALEAELRTGAKANLLSSSVVVEEFVADVLNRAYSWQLTNANARNARYPCIDLVDSKNELAVQVTVDGSSKKMQSTLNCIAKNAQLFPSASMTLKLFVAGAKQRRYTPKNVPAHVSFDWRHDILDFADVHTHAAAVLAPRQLHILHDCVVAAMPSVFASQSARRDAAVKEIRDIRNLFERELLDAPFHLEEPVAMLLSLQELRTDLQKRGALTLNMPQVRNAFRRTHKILRECERKVRGEFPRVGEAAREPGAREGRYQTDLGDEYGPAIQTMMGIRGELQPILDELDELIQELEQAA